MAENRVTQIAMAIRDQYLMHDSLARKIVIDKLAAEIDKVSCVEPSIFESFNIEDCIPTSVLATNALCK